MKLQKLWEEIKVTQDMVQQLGGSRPDVQEVDEALPDTIFDHLMKWMRSTTDCLNPHFKEMW